MPQECVEPNTQASTNEASLNKLPQLHREVAKRARQLMQGDLCTSHAFPESEVIKIMAKECIAEAVKLMIPIGTDEADGMSPFQSSRFFYTNMFARTEIIDDWRILKLVSRLLRVSISMLKWLT